MRKITVTKLVRPIASGDHHDRPLRWRVDNGAFHQLFSTQADAKRFASLWRRLGFNEAINAFVAS